MHVRSIIFTRKSAREEIIKDDFIGEHVQSIKVNNCEELNCNRAALAGLVVIQGNKLNSIDLPYKRLFLHAIRIQIGFGQ